MEQWQCLRDNHNLYYWGYIHLTNLNPNVSVDSNFFLQNENDPPLYLVARNSGSLAGPEAFKEMPKTLRISGQKYQLGMLIMFDSARQHFTSLHYINQEFVYYDGLMCSKKKFRRPLPTDYKQENIVMDHALYVKTINNKEI